MVLQLKKERADVGYKNAPEVFLPRLQTTNFWGAHVVYRFMVGNEKTSM